MAEAETTECQTTKVNGDKKENEKDRRPWWREPLPFPIGILLAAVVWTISVVVTVRMYTGSDDAKASVAILAALAASAVGGLIGFLFGVPRSPLDRVDNHQVAVDTQVVAPATRSRDDVNGRDIFRPNTNLEQVSDWLTKIIVGVGLIQFREIGNGIGDVGRSVGAAVGDFGGAPGSGTVFAIGLMSASAVVTFLLAYMWTTTVLFDVYRTHVAGMPPRKKE